MAAHLPLPRVFNDLWGSGFAWSEGEKPKQQREPGPEAAEIPARTQPSSHPEQPPNAAGPRLPPCPLLRPGLLLGEMDPCCPSCGPTSSQISSSAAPDRPPHGSAQQQTAGLGTNTRWFPAHFNLEGEARGNKPKFTPKRHFRPCAVTPRWEEPPSSREHPWGCQKGSPSCDPWPEASISTQTRHGESTDNAQSCSYRAGKGAAKPQGQGGHLGSLFPHVPGGWQHPRGYPEQLRACCCQPGAAQLEKERPESPNPFSFSWERRRNWNKEDSGGQRAPSGSPNSLGVLARSFCFNSFFFKKRDLFRNHTVELVLPGTTRAARSSGMLLRCRDGSSRGVRACGCLACCPTAPLQTPCVTEV